MPRDRQPAGEIGEVIDGRYRLISLLGEGAMGAVYCAEPTDGGPQLALKLLRPEIHERKKFRDRFEREALVTARIQHPHCASVHDFGRCPDGRLYLVMELLVGKSLADILDERNKLPVEEALPIILQVLEALDACHKAGVIHRDLKPENIFLHSTPGGSFVKLVDFGIAKLMGEAEVGQAKLTSVGLILGTPSYIAPEWVSRDDVDGRADLYAATVVLYEMLTGLPPFYGQDKSEVMRMHMRKPPPTLAEAEDPPEGITPDLEALIASGLKKEPEERFSDAAAMRHVVLQIMGVDSVAPRPASKEKTWAMPTVAVVPPASGAPAAAQPAAAAAPAAPFSGAYAAVPRTAPPARSGGFVAPRPAASASQAAAPAPQPIPQTSSGQVAVQSGPTPQPHTPSRGFSPPPQSARSSAAMMAQSAPGAAGGTSAHRTHGGFSLAALTPRQRRNLWIVCAGATFLLVLILAVTSGGESSEPAEPGKSSEIDDTRVEALAVGPALAAWREAKFYVRGFKGGALASLTGGRCVAGTLGKTAVALCRAPEGADEDYQLLLEEGLSAKRRKRISAALDKLSVRTL